MLKSSDYKAYSKFIENLAKKLTKLYYTKLNILSESSRYNIVPASLFHPPRCSTRHGFHICRDEPFFFNVPRYSTRDVVPRATLFHPRGLPPAAGRPAGVRRGGAPRHSRILAGRRPAIIRKRMMMMMIMMMMIIMIILMIFI